MWPGYGKITFFAQPNAIGYVIDDPMCIYDIQANNSSGLIPGNGTTTGTTSATSGATATIDNSNTGDPILGISGMQLDLLTNKPINVPTTTTGNIYPLKIIGVTQVPGNVYGIPFMNFQVSINYGVYSAGQLGV
jgi:hypothetical protein